MRVVVDRRVLAGVIAWIGHRRVGIRGMRLELGVLVRIGCGGGANVIVGDVRSHRTIAGALPAVFSHRSRSSEAEWRKLTRPLGIGGDRS